ncbi:copper resistance protein CopC [Cellulomonas sp. WB94]|uniref:copper resistance CopC/CopD family protein n=1 Tax=Cellulomonas sp. WB94 TaxID=2173174 RepID=UPI0013049FCC|nr:copper resistance protein CopC [Cellulomonas sp. WB94]
MRARSTVTRIGLAGLVAALAVLVGPVPAAQAHAFLAGSSPADGQVLVDPPAQVRLDFSESVVLSATRIDVVDATGRHLDLAGLRIESGADAADLEQPVEVVVDVPAMDHGAYRVSWSTLSSDDLHATEGVLVFGVGQAVTAGGLDEPSPRPVEATLRWLLLLGLSGALGGPLALRLLVRADGSDRAASFARRAASGGAVGGAVVAVLLLVDQLTASGADPVRLLGGDYGGRWAVREVGLVVLAVSGLSRVRASRRHALLLAAGATLACLGTAVLGHSAGGGGLDLTRIAASAAHLAAATTWSGCLTVLTVAVVLSARGGPAARLVGSRALRAFGPPAAVCVSVMVVTGVYLSSGVVGSVDAALGTSYGRALLLKVGLAAVVGALALVNTSRLHRAGGSRTQSTQSTPRLPRRTILAEAVLGLVVLGLAAVLTSGQPAMEPQLVQSANGPTDGPVVRQVVDLQETLDIRPNRPGPNVVIVEVFDTRRPAPAPVRTVEVTVAAADGTVGTPAPAEPLGNGRWSVNVTLASAGSAQVQVVAHRDGLADAAVDYPWSIGSLTGPPIARVSTAPIRAQLRAAALAVSLAVLLAWWAALAVAERRRSSRTDPTGDAAASVLPDERTIRGRT